MAQTIIVYMYTYYNDQRKKMCVHCNEQVLTFIHVIKRREFA